MQTSIIDIDGRSQALGSRKESVDSTNKGSAQNLKKSPMQTLIFCEADTAVVTITSLLIECIAFDSATL